VAELKSEWPRLNRNRWPTSFRNQWPTSPGISNFAGQPFERLLARGREVHDIGALAHLSAKMLAGQIRDIGLVVDNQDADTHAVISEIASALRSSQ
jgi:hypothetical protein